MENIFSKDSDIELVDIENSIKGSYLDYSMSVIIGRALPDARDGLKPVHRRILYAMQNDEAKSRTDFVIGVQWHPEMMTKSYDKMQNIFKALIEEASKKIYR